MGVLMVSGAYAHRKVQLRAFSSKEKVKDTPIDSEEWVNGWRAEVVEEPNT
jgi:hypothetical protein